MADNEAYVRYYAAAPAAEPSEAPAGAPTLELLGTARWEYPEYDAVRLFGDKEGVGFARSMGDVQGGILAGNMSHRNALSQRQFGMNSSNAIGSSRGEMCLTDQVDQPCVPDGSHGGRP